MEIGDEGWLAHAPGRPVASLTSLALVHRLRTYRKSILYARAACNVNMLWVCTAE